VCVVRSVCVCAAGWLLILRVTFLERDMQIKGPGMTYVTLCVCFT
jgi:hypothetical protein